MPGAKKVENGSAIGRERACEQRIIVAADKTSRWKKEASRHNRGCEGKSQKETLTGEVGEIFNRWRRGVGEGGENP